MLLVVLVSTVTPPSDYFADLKVSGGAVWASVQNRTAQKTRLLRGDFRTNEMVVAPGSVATNSYGRLVADQGRACSAVGDGLAQVAS